MYPAQYVHVQSYYYQARILFPLQLCTLYSKVGMNSYSSAAISIDMNGFVVL